MKAIRLSPGSSLENCKLLLLGTAVGLIAIHLSITWKSENTNLWGMSALFWVAVSSLVWKKRNNLSLKTDFFSSFIGTLCIALVLIKSTSHSNNFLYISPLISAVGLGLVASGFKGLKQYWQELLILFFLGVPQVTLLSLIDISALTAKFAAFVLWYLGFKVSLQGVNINLPGGGVEVFSGCSGMESILHLWGLAVLFLVMFPTKGSKRILVPMVAVLLAFLINGVRVVLMALLAVSSNQQAFKYWHKGDGSLIFSMISVLLFGLFCLFMLRVDPGENEDSVEL